MYRGKGVLHAVGNVNDVIAPALVGKDPIDQRGLDQMMRDLDGTPNKGKLGGNAIVGVSMAICRAAAITERLPLYRYIGKLFGNEKYFMPRPMILLMEGGKHGNWSTDIQEYMVMPNTERFPSFSERLRAGSDMFHALEKILDKKGMGTGVGFEGAFCPKEVKSNAEAIELLIEAISAAGFVPGKDVEIALDAAASEFWQADGNYHFKSDGGRTLTSSQWIDEVVAWTQKYPLKSLEDMCGQEDWASWAALNAKIGGSTQVAGSHQIVGDDLVTTNVERIKKAIDQKAINSVLIKVNQIGTVSETLDAIALTHTAGYISIVSHRGGETNDDFIADLCVGTGSEQCKFGGPDRGERLAKYNQLLRIEEELHYA
jgi:enolase